MSGPGSRGLRIWISARSKRYIELEAEGIAEIEKVSAVPERIVVSRAADMRYVGQEHSVTVDLAVDLFANEDRAGIKERFDAVHDLRYGTCAPQERSEIVSLRVTVTGMLESLSSSASNKGTRPHLQMRIPAYGRSGSVTNGWRPALGTEAVWCRATRSRARHWRVEEHASTTVLHPGDGLTVDDYGNLKISIGSNAS